MVNFNGLDGFYIFDIMMWGGAPHIVARWWDTAIGRRGIWLSGRRTPFLSVGTTPRNRPAFLTQFLSREGLQSIPADPHDELRR